jgi:perosamine synthetase
MTYQLSAGKFFQKFAWYPPAETKIPLSAFYFSLFSCKDRFEKPLCSYLGVRHCVLAHSGRALLSSLLSALKKRDGGKRTEVIIPGYTCYSVVASVVKAGLTIRLYDMDPVTLNPDTDSLTRALSPGTLALIGQHLFGLPAPMDELQEIAEENDIYLIEDAAQALGGSAKGRPLGTMGDFGLYSFGRGKPLPVGGGGALIGKHEAVLSVLEVTPKWAGMMPFLKTAMAQLFSYPVFYGIPEMLPLGLGEAIFDPDFDGAAMPALMERLAMKSLHTLDGLNAHRQRIANIYQGAFDESASIPAPKEANPVYTRFPYMAGPGTISPELKRLGVRRMYPRAIADETAIQPYLTATKDATPGASEIARNLITLPTHTCITENLANHIASKVIANDF